LAVDRLFLGAGRLDAAFLDLDFPVLAEALLAPPRRPPAFRAERRFFVERADFFLADDFLRLVAMGLSPRP
jgi:hypothetical protein